MSSGQAPSRNLFFIPTTVGAAIPRWRDTSVDMTLRELLKNFFIETDAAFEIFNRKILVW